MEVIIQTSILKKQPSLQTKIKELSYEEKKEKRQTASRADLDAFWSWCDKTGNIPTTNEKLTKALNYATGHRAQLETFLEDADWKFQITYVNPTSAHLQQPDDPGYLQTLLKEPQQVLLHIY